MLQENLQNMKLLFLKPLKFTFHMSGKYGKIWKILHKINVDRRVSEGEFTFLVKKLPQFH